MAEKVKEPRGGARGYRHRAAELLARAGTLAAAVMICGCATLGQPDGAATADEATGAAPEAPEAPGAPEALTAGIGLYDKGEYVATIRALLTSDEIWRGSLQTRITAQKYVAFSHCLLSRPQPCTQSFIDLLRMKPDFELGAAEAGHPQWGAAFREAKRKAAATTSADSPLAQSSR